MQRENIFLVWVIRNYITDAKFPVRFAIRNIEEGNTPEGYYLELESLGWGSIQDILKIRIESLDIYGHGELEEEKEETVQIYRKLPNGTKETLKDSKKTRTRALFEKT